LTFSMISPPGGFVLADTLSLGGEPGIARSASFCLEERLASWMGLLESQVRPEPLPSRCPVLFGTRGV
jgi:hypothetical protein